jgi:hybrid cluster-associated redox disulfide protein
MKKTSKQFITKDTLIGEMVEKYPELGEVLMDDYGFHCIGCSASGVETLGEGAMVHGMNSKEIANLVKTLNGLIEDAKKKS